MPISWYMKYTVNNIRKSSLTVKDVAVLGLMVASIEAGKLALAVFPNVEIVTLLIILYTIFYGSKTLIAVFAFVGVECLIWGVQLWTIMYLYIWPLLCILVLIFRKNKSVWFNSILSGVFGLAFGALCSIPYFFIGGIRTALTWWIAGIPFDLVHGISNFILCLLLFVPLNKTLDRIKQTL